LGFAGYLIFSGPDPVPEKSQAEQPAKPPVLESLALQPGSMELQAGQSRKFMIEARPAQASAQVRWESADPSIASVQNGEVYANRPGSTTIRAISLEKSGIAGSAEVTVAAAALPEPQPQPKLPTGERPKPDPKPNPEKQPGPGAQTNLAGQAQGAGQSQAGGQNTTTNAGTGQAGGQTPAQNLSGFKSILTVTSAPPFAEVIVDGRFVGTTPVKDKELSAGRHKIQISHRSFPTIDTVVTLGPGEKTLRFRLFK
jgi:hypothetical protein